MTELALLETEMQPAEMLERLRGHPDEVDVPVEHYFAPGLYGRKVTFTAGTFVVGKKHKTTHISVLAKGCIVVRGVAGQPDHRMVAGDVMVTPAGSQRAAYVVQDSVFLCVHLNEDNETDVDILESKFIELPLLENVP